MDWTLFQKSQMRYDYNIILGLFSMAQDLLRWKRKRGENRFRNTDAKIQQLLNNFKKEKTNMQTSQISKKRTDKFIKTRLNMLFIPTPLPEKTIDIKMLGTTNQCWARLSKAEYGHCCVQCYVQCYAWCYMQCYQQHFIHCL